jgi:hypothetical protein
VASKLTSVGGNQQQFFKSTNTNELKNKENNINTNECRE